MFSGSSNESYNTSLELGMFSDVGVTHEHVLLELNCYLQIPMELPPIPKVDNDTIVMIIEQLLMLLLIIGRWMLPKVRKNVITIVTLIMLILLYRAR